jgi:hypothetical protein
MWKVEVVDPEPVEGVQGGHFIELLSTFPFSLSTTFLRPDLML